MFETIDTLVVKLTKKCNLACTYCYVKDSNDETDTAVTLDLFKTTVDRIASEKLKQNNARDFTINILGGEPTLIGKSSFGHMCEYATHIFNKHNLPLRLSLQTNLILVDEEWCMLFDKYNIWVGVSWDGVGEANSLRNPDSEQMYIDKIDLMKKYGVRFGVQLMMNSKSHSLYDESVKFMNDRFGVYHHKANWIESSPDSDISGNDYFTIYKKEIDNIIETGDSPEKNIRDIVEMFFIDYFTNLNTLNASAGQCGVKYCGAGLNIATLNPNGMIQLCGRSGDTLDGETILSHVSDPDFLSAHQIKKYLSFVKEKSEVMKDLGCDTCIAQGICDHGCMSLHRAVSGKWGINSDFICSLYKTTYNYLQDNVNKVFRSFLNHKLDKNGKYHINVSGGGNIDYYHIDFDKIQKTLKGERIEYWNEGSDLVFKRK